MDELKQEVFEYLDKLRESSTTNMFGSVRYICEEFGVGSDEARNLLSEWMKTFSERHPDLAK